MVALGAALLLMTQNPARDAALAKAEAAVQAAIPIASADPDRPLVHFHAPAQWMNDPNGPIFYKGWYHLFYQLHPFGAESGTKYWGHARSRDLVRWEERPIALWPSKEQGESEVWSGSIVLGLKGKPVLFYTSIGKDREPEQWIATPEDDDLDRWHKDPVRITQSVNGAGPIAEWRDPFLFDDFGLKYLITGGGRNGRGIVALYKATDETLRAWQYLGDLFTHPDKEVRNLECPNLFQLDGKWVLLVSVWPHVEAFVGDLRNTEFISERRSVLGEGSYASQIFGGVSDRVIETAWVPTGGHRGWNGYLTLPSELRVAKDGTLLRTPVKELTKLRGEGTSVRGGAVEGDLALPEGEVLEIEATVEPGEASRVGLRLRSGAFTVLYDPATRRLSANDRSVILPEGAVKKGLKLRLFLDRTALDVYAADGAASLVATVQTATGRENVLFAEGGKAKFGNVKAYALHPEREH